MSGPLTPSGLWREMSAADRAVSAAVIVVAALLGLTALAPRQALEAHVLVGSELVEVLPLADDAVREIDGRTGKIRVEVASGSVRVSASSCPGKICVSMGRRKRAGEMIACVPNAVVIRLAGPPDDDTPDSVAR